MQQRRELPTPSKWSLYHSGWQSRLRDFGLDPSRLTRTVEVHANYDAFFGLPKAAWWDIKKCDEYLVSLNATLLEGRVRGLDYDPDGLDRSGPLATLRALRKTDGDSEANCALLTLASLHSRHAGRSYDSDLLDRREGEDLAAEFRKVLKARNIETPWMHAHRNVLLETSDDYHYRFNSKSAVARYFAEEHASNFCQFAAVVFQPVPDLSESMTVAIHDLNAERAAQEARDRLQAEEWERQWQAERAQAAAAAETQLAEVSKRRVAAGYEPIEALGHWGRVSDEELKRLLWTMPVIYIGDQFGVSDVAVHKAAKSRGIAKPPAGFWNRVAAGKIPHPGGVPAKA